MVVTTPTTSGDPKRRATRLVARTREEACREAAAVLGATPADEVEATEAVELGPEEARVWNDWHKVAPPLAPSD